MNLTKYFVLLAIFVKSVTKAHKNLVNSNKKAHGKLAKWENEK